MDYPLPGYSRNPVLRSLEDDLVEEGGMQGGMERVLPRFLLSHEMNDMHLKMNVEMQQMCVLFPVKTASLKKGFCARIESHTTSERRKNNLEFNIVYGMLPESQGNNLASTILYVPYSLDSGRGPRTLSLDRDWGLTTCLKRSRVVLRSIKTRTPRILQWPMPKAL